MQGRTNTLISAAILLLAMPGHPLAQTMGTGGDGGGHLAFRATRPDLPAALIRYVAIHAEPTLLNSTTHPAAREASARRIIQSNCGKLESDYEDIFRSRNGLPLAFDMDAPLGSRAYEIIWPACFYVSEQPVEVRVADQVLSQAFLDLTGRSGTSKEMQRYFQYKDINRVQPGLKLPVQFWTLPVAFVPTVDKATFTNAVTALAIAPNGVSKSSIVMQDLSKMQDEIVTAAGNSDDGSYVPPLDCVDPSAPPFDVDRIRSTLQRLSGLQKRNEVNVTVLDNGFGAARLDQGRITFASKFPKQLFELSNKPGEQESLGKAVPISDSVRIEPIIDLASTGTPLHVAGHGTHVTGTIIGGQWFDPALSLFALADDDAWLRIRLMPLSAGSKKVSRMALTEAAVRIDLSNPHIVNMSVRYGVSGDSRLEDVISSNRNTLFVVAAGNDSQDVIGRIGDTRTLTPASLGGARNANVLTIAAEDGRGYLAQFSNYGEANVDIAAPGCNIPAWLDGEQVSMLSGTSQATALASFASILLARYKLDASNIKRRIITSGDILEGARQTSGGVSKPVPADDTQPLGIYSRSRISLEKALLFEHDYVRMMAVDVSEPGASRWPIELLGNLQVQGHIRCGTLTDGSTVLALKRSASGALWCFPRDLKPHQASVNEDFQVYFTIREHIFPAHQLPSGFLSGQTIRIPLEDLQEFIRSESSMTYIMEQR